MKLHVHLDGEQVLAMREAAVQAGTQFDPNTKVKSTLLDLFGYSLKNGGGGDILYHDFPASHVYKRYTPRAGQKPWRGNRASLPIWRAK